SGGTWLCVVLHSSLVFCFLRRPLICGGVSRWLFLRPPVFFFGSTSRFSGRHFVISSKAGSDLKRSVGVNGRNSFRAITVWLLDEVYLLAFLQSHDRLLPLGASSHRATHTFLLARVITSVHVEHFLLEHAFDCVLDLNLVRPRTNAKDVLVLFFAHQG